MKLPKEKLTKSLFIADVLQQEMENGIIGECEKLPSETFLSHRFHTNRYTVRQALDHLVKIGMIQPKKGVGYFVSNKPLELSFTITPFTRFSKMIEDAGFKPGAMVICQEKKLPPEPVKESLQLSKEEEVFYLEILRFADDIPIALNGTWLPVALFPELLEYTKEYNSLYNILEEKYNVVPERLSSTFQSIIPTAHESMLLHISPSTPLLKIDSTVGDTQGKRMEFTSANYRGDLCKVTTQL